jgi:hypothetical protein
MDFPLYVFFLDGVDNVQLIKLEGTACLREGMLLCICMTLETGLQWEVKMQTVIYASLNRFLLRRLQNDSYEQYS